MNSIRNATPTPRATGFTLLELVMVMLLISTLLAIAAPSLRGFVAGRKAPDTAREVLAVLRWARSEAIARGERFVFHVSEDGRTYRLTRFAEGAEASAIGDMGRTWSAGPGVKVELTVAGAPAHELTIHPTGRAHEATVTVTGPDGGALRIVAPSATERFAIVPGEGAQP